MYLLKVYINLFFFSLTSYEIVYLVRLILIPLMPPSFRQIWNYLLECGV